MCYVLTTFFVLEYILFHCNLQRIDNRLPHTERSDNGNNVPLHYYKK